MHLYTFPQEAHLTGYELFMSFLARGYVHFASIAKIIGFSCGIFLIPLSTIALFRPQSGSVLRVCAVPVSSHGPATGNG